MDIRRISLTDEMIENIDNDIEGCDHYEGGCLCGYYEMYIEDIGYITVNTHCRKVSECPKDMNWFVEDIAKVWNRSVCTYGYVPTEEETNKDKDLELLGCLDDYSSKEIKQIIREDIIANHSWNNSDEYGRQIDYSIEPLDGETEIFKSNYDYEKAYESLIGYLIDLKASCDNCGTDRSCCEVCKQGTQMWSFNHELIDELDQIESFRF